MVTKKTSVRDVGPDCFSNLANYQNPQENPIKVHTAKTMMCSVVMYGYKRWTIKKAEC